MFQLKECASPLLCTVYIINSDTLLEDEGTQRRLDAGYKRQLYQVFSDTAEHRIYIYWMLDKDAQIIELGQTQA